MIYEFKSRATGSVIMTRAVAEWILQIVGKAPGRTGIITVDQMPGAIDALNRAIEQEREALRAERRAMEFGTPGASARGVAPAAAPAGSVGSTGASGAKADDTDPTDHDPYPVSLAQRAFPFIEMLKQAHKAGKDVTWGV